MGIMAEAPEKYKNSLRTLFPRGQYWDNQFKNPESDCSLFCEAKAGLLVRLRKRMSDLQKESVIQSAGETIGDWERVLLGGASVGLDINRRRELLYAAKITNINISLIREIGRIYGITVNDAVFPYRPGFFGHSRFGVEPITGPAAFSVLFVRVSQTDTNTQSDFEKHLSKIILSNYVVHYIYGGL